MRTAVFSLAFALAGCANSTHVERADEPVLSVVGSPPALPAVPEPPPPPPPPPPKVELTEEAIALVEPIVFGAKDDQFAPESTAVLEELHALLDAHPELVRISIEVHTDAEGSRGANKKLARRRAAAISDYLVAQGIVEQRLETKAWGESKPLPKGPDGEEPASSRRVEILVLERSPPPTPAPKSEAQSEPEPKPGTESERGSTP